MSNTVIQGKNLENKNFPVDIVASSSGLLYTGSYTGAKLTLGEFYVSHILDQAVADSGTVAMGITTPSISEGLSVIQPDANVEGNFTIGIIEGATITVASTIAATNFNRTSSNTYSGTIEDVTSYTGGTLLQETLLLGGTQGSRGGAASLSLDFAGFVLKPDTSYILLLTNISGSVQIGELICNIIDRAEVLGNE